MSESRKSKQEKMQMIEVKVLGTGCPKCKRLEQLTYDAAAETNLDVNIEKVTDIEAITSYPILGTPGLVINEKVASSGRLPRKGEIIDWLSNA
jgi:small redox-active disulfide protein 2